MKIRKSERTKTKMKICLAGPSGSGKTYSSLLLAKGLVGDWSKICLIDSENGSGDFYSSLGDYSVITLEDHKPSDYIKAIEMAEEAGFECIIIDSITHEWKYLLDQVEKIAQASANKNSYTAWAKITPHHDKFVQKIIQSTSHIITTVRSKQDYDIGKNDSGKTIVTKVGMKQETRDGFDYEVAICFDINIKHTATANKDRTNLFIDDIPFVIDEKVGEKIKKWNELGK